MRPNVDLPNDLPSDLDWSYACPTHKKRNAISAGVFKNHILKTHPSTNSDVLPPEHTIVIEGDFQTSTKKLFIKSYKYSLVSNFNNMQG